jgi:very-short-patch-repair endonuclease
MATRQKRNKTALVQCRKLAGAQHGVLTRAQALECGLSEGAIDRLVAEGEWERCARSVYRIVGTGTDRYQAFMVLSLWAGDQGIVSHSSAAAIWDMRGVKMLRLEATVMTGRQPPREDVTLHRVRCLDEADVAIAHGIRTSTPVRTVCDLSGSLSGHDLEIVVDDCLRRGLFSLARLRWQVSRTGMRRKGSRTLRTILEERAPSFRPTTALETRIARVLRRSDYILPSTQYEVVDRRGFVARLDFAWPEQRVGIECDSYEWHSGRAAWRRDTVRLNNVIGAGWKVLRATDEDARDPDSLLERLKGLIPRRSQGDLFQRTHEVRGFPGHGQVGR